MSNIKDMNVDKSEEEFTPEQLVPRAGCVYCQRLDGQVKAGVSSTGAQRFKCSHCRRRYAAEPVRGYPKRLREEALRLYDEGASLRDIGRRLSINHQTARNWIHEAESLTENATHSVAQSDTADISQNQDVPRAQTAPRDDAVADLVALEPQQRRPTIHDVAAAAGVSNSTVSNYLNQKGHMSPATLKRVESAIELLHFTPSALVRAIRRHKTHIFGVVLFGLSRLDVDVAKSITPPLLAGINQAAEDAEYDVLLYPGWLDRPHRHPGLPFLNGHIDGLLWVAPDRNDPYLKRVADAGLPVVALLTRETPERAGYVNVDNFAAINLLVSHLVSLGHRRIAFLGREDSSDFRDRRSAYQQALAAHGLPERATYDIVIENHWSADAYRDALDRCLSLAVSPTAILLPSDGMASLMIEAMQARGLRAPEDLSISGFDDVPHAKEISSGGLTTIRQPFRQIGMAAVERLIALIDGASVESCRVTLPPEIVLRGTTGPPSRPLRDGPPSV